MYMYIDDNLFPVVLDVAAENSKKAMDKFNKNRSRAKSSGRLLTVKGTTASGRGSVKNVWKEFKVQVAHYCKATFLCV